MTIARRPLLFSSILLIGLSIFGLQTPAARASARFTYELCDPVVPGGNPPTLEFLAPPGTPFYGWQNCAVEGGAVGLVIPAAAPTNGATLTVGIPATPGGFVEGETITAYPQEVQSGSDSGYVYEPGWPVENAGEQTRYFLIRREPTPLSGDDGSFDIRMECGASCSYAEAELARYIAVEEVDTVPPTVSKVEGGLVDGSVVRGRQTLSAEAIDTGGGVSFLEARVNGTPAPGSVQPRCATAEISNLGYRGLAATTPSPCPSTATASWNLDTAAAPFRQGANTVQICASDFATTGSPNITCSPDQSVEVDDSCTESPVEGGHTIDVALGRDHAETATTAHSKSSHLHGKLADSSGLPVSGAAICIQAETEGSKTGFLPLATATTDAQGGFAYQVPPGPNRRILVGYRHGPFETTQILTLRSHAWATLHATPASLRNRQRVRLRGRLAGADTGDRILILQANVLGSHRWITFRRATTDRRGRFTSSYLFRSTMQKTTYRFRAVVPTQAGYPWVQGHSKPVSVRVKP